MSRRGSWFLSAAKRRCQRRVSPAAPAALCATPCPRPVPSPVLLEVGAVPTPPDVVLSRPSAVAPVVAARVSVKSALAPSSSPVRVFVLLSSGCGGVFSSFNCLRRASVDLFVVLLPLIQSSHTQKYIKETPKNPTHRKNNSKTQIQQQPQTQKVQVGESDSGIREGTRQGQGWTRCWLEPGEENTGLQSFQLRLWWQLRGDKGVGSVTKAERAPARCFEGGSCGIR